MSIATSPEERKEAVDRLSRLDEAVLERDLVHWTLAAFETDERWHELQRQVEEIRELPAEEQAWIRLHGDELRRRRARRRGEERS